MEYNDLVELYEALRARAEPMTDSLPLFGGDAPGSGTSEVWSWDENRVLVGTCPDDLQIVSREDWES